MLPLEHGKVATLFIRFLIMYRFELPLEHGKVATSQAHHYLQAQHRYRLSMVKLQRDDGRAGGARPQELPLEHGKVATMSNCW